MSLTFAVVLRCLAFWLLLVSVVSSPVRREPVCIPIVGFPRRNNVRDALHPIMIHRQHLNRGVRRLASMIGQPVPGPHELFGEVYNRVSAAASLHQAHRGGLETFSFVAPSSNGTVPVVPPDLTPSSSSSIPNTIGLGIEANDLGYVGVVEIGTPPHKFNLLMDSGSADMWVGFENCKGDDAGGCGDHNFLGPSSSSTFKSLVDDWSIVYGSGAVSGHLARDVVSIASLTLSSHKFGVALNESSDFTPDDVPFDGLLGLAKSVISRQRTPTLVEALFKAQLISQPIASYRIPRLSDGRNDGEMMLGALNPTKYYPETLVTVSNTNPFGFWEVPLEDVIVGKISIGWGNRTAVLDTGTTLLLAPESDVQALHKAIDGAKQDESGSWTVPCNLSTSLSFKIGGAHFAVDPRDIAFLAIDPQNPQGDCVSGIGVGYVGPFDSATQWLVGDVFLKNVYFSTHIGKDEISLAQARP